MFKAPFLTALGTGLGLGAAAVATLVGLRVVENTENAVYKVIEDRKTNLLERSPAIQAWYAERERRIAAEKAMGMNPQQQAA